VAINRRTPTERGFLNHPNPNGPVDHSVPVLAAHDPTGKLKAVVFGYACHNTTMGFYRWLGDYAGFAQGYFQADHPGVTALFMMGCGGDQNPYPRSELKYAKMHGRSLATAVEAALETNQRTLRHQRPVRRAIKTAMIRISRAKPTRGNHLFIAYLSRALPRRAERRNKPGAGKFSPEGLSSRSAGSIFD
jgi:hypothetical protein